MALALLTGCGKATSLNRTVAEGVADYVKYSLSQLQNNNKISVSYQFPKLSRDIAPLFDENWITKDNSGKDALTNAAKETLTGILSPYQSAVQISFSAADVTDVKTPFMEGTNLISSMIVFTTDDGSFDATSVTTIKVAVTHKTINDRTYALAVIIYEA